MYADSGTLHVHKGFMGWSGFLRAWKKHQDKKAVLHFRIRTHGKTDAANTHPFQVGESLAFVHNGTIGNVSIDDKDFSDTYHFNTKLMKKLYKSDRRFIFKEHYQELVEAYIGWSKLIFLDSKGNHVIVNESKGKWDDEVWYSNESYKRRTYASSSPSTSIKPYTPPAHSPVNPPKIAEGGYLTVGCRVKLKGHPSLEGSGFIAYFGNGASIGVKLDGSEMINLIHSGFVFPEPVVRTAKHEFKVGDYVCRVGSNVLGEILDFKGNSALVEFYNTKTEKTHTIYQSVDNLEPWELMQGY